MIHLIIVVKLLIYFEPVCNVTMESEHFNYKKKRTGTCQTPVDLLTRTDHILRNRRHAASIIDVTIMRDQTSILIIT